MLTFNSDGMVAQRFPFPAPIMDYIFKNVQPQHLLKLYQCCKFFYAKYGLNIIKNLVIVDDFDEEETFDLNTTIIRASNPALKKLKDFWITDSFIHNALLNDDIMPFFSHCTIKKLEASNYLIWKEFEALTKAGTIQDLKVARIYRAYLVPVEEIIAQVPNATSIEITGCILASTSFAALSALNHQVKITKFVLNHIHHPDNFNIDLLFEFLNNNADPDCNVHFDFDMDFFIDEELEQLGIEYTNIITARLQAKKKEIALEKSTLMP